MVRTLLNLKLITFLILHFGISNNYLWDAVSFEVDKNPGRRVYCAAAYRQTSPDFVDVAYYAKETLKYFSFEIPGVPYPYPSATVFNGAGGMEFPMIVNNGREDDKAGTVGLNFSRTCTSVYAILCGNE